MTISIKEIGTGTAILLTALVLAGCSSPRTRWYGGEDPNPEFVDVYYIVSTDVIRSVDDNGKESPVALLREEEKAEMLEEMEYVRRAIFPDSVNFISPYYHQATLDCLLGEDGAEVMEQVEDEALSQLLEYLGKVNRGRKFILAGFSQGAMLVKHLVKNMPQDAFDRMVAAFVIGDGINGADLASGRIRPAQGAFDKGVCICFNSVRSPESIWPLVQEDSKVCINPVNWRTDAAEAVFDYEGQTLSAAVDTLRKVVVVGGFEMTSDWEAAPWPEGNYHHFEILFYADCLRRNALDRAYR